MLKWSHFRTENHAYAEVLAFGLAS